MTCTLQHQELAEAREKIRNGKQLSHKDCLILLIRQEITHREFCERNLVVRDQWSQYLQLIGKEKPGSELDAENFFEFIAEWVNDPADAGRFWSKGCPLQ